MMIIMYWSSAKPVLISNCLRKQGVVSTKKNQSFFHCELFWSSQVKDIIFKWLGFNHKMKQVRPPAGSHQSSWREHQEKRPCKSLLSHFQFAVINIRAFKVDTSFTLRPFSGYPECITPLLRSLPQWLSLCITCHRENV